MRFNILCDANWEAKIDKVFDALDNTGYRHFFEGHNYGDYVYGITIVLMCQPANLGLKQRIRFSKKEKKLYLDIMLDLALFINIDQSERDKIVAAKIMKEVPEIVAKYNFRNFDFERFRTDLNKVFKEV